MSSTITENNLRRIFNQFNTQSGRVLVIELLNEILDKDRPLIGSQIAQTLLERIRSDGYCDPSDKQLYRLAQVVEREGIDLGQFWAGTESQTAQSCSMTNTMRGLVISRTNEGIVVLLSDKSIRSFSNTFLDPGLFVEIRQSTPEICPFESGRDDVWLENIWPILVEKFENNQVDVDAFIIAGKKVRIGLVNDFFIHSHRSDKEIVCRRIVLQ